MKITSFNPLVLTTQAADAVALFEALGFERRHNKVGEEFNSNSMKNESGFHVDVTQVEKLLRDLTAIRMNVDDFDEAYDLLLSRGFTMFPGGQVTDTGTSRSAMLVSPSGFPIVVAQHIKG